MYLSLVLPAFNLTSVTSARPAATSTGWEGVGVGVEVLSEDRGRDGGVGGEGGSGDKEGDGGGTGEEGGAGARPARGGDDGKEIGGEGERRAVARVSFSELSVSVSVPGCSTSFVLHTKRTTLSQCDPAT